MDKIVIPESVHAYTYLGEPVPLMPLSPPRKDGICPNCNKFFSRYVKRDRSKCPHCKVKVDISSFAVTEVTKTTTKHFFKYGLFPSASRLAQFGERPIELSEWYENRMIKFCWEHYQPNYEAYIKACQQDFQAMKDEYSNRGTQIHSDIQKDLDGEVVTGPSVTSLKAIQNIRDWLTKMNAQSCKPERAYCDPILGIGGTIDLDFISNGQRIINDYKTKHSESTFEKVKEDPHKHLKPRGYMFGATKQLAAYQEISRMDHKADRVFVSPIRVDDNHPDTGETLFIELTDDELARGLRAITAAQNAWCANLNYWPQEMYKNGECWSLSEIMAGAKS